MIFLTDYVCSIDFSMNMKVNIYPITKTTRLPTYNHPITQEKIILQRYYSSNSQRTKTTIYC